MSEKIFEKFSFHSRSALKHALRIARKMHQGPADPSHILYGILQEKGSLGYEILKQTNINSEEILNFLKEYRTKKPSSQQGLEGSLTKSSKKILEKATNTANIYNHRYIGTEHVLFGILEAEVKDIVKFLETKKINISMVKNKVHAVLKSTSKFPDLTDAIDAKGNEGMIETEKKGTKTKNKVLEFYGKNLTNETIQDAIDPVIGRQDEIERLVQILCRRTKNNPLLLGDPGVGKTAIVEGLAKKIVAGDVPEVLLDKKIYTLDLALIIAGSSFRGEFENRLKNIIGEIKEDPNIILFIDEIHNIIGAGSATGSMDAANILKPSLARGEIRCIGATTLEEYKKYIENDLALERRFQPIHVDQPSLEKTIEILKGLRPNYEKYHRVKISDQAIHAATHLSSKYIQDKFLPDKAIDLIDEAAAAYRIKNFSDGKIKKIKSINNEMKTLQILKQKAVFAENFDLALEFRQKEELLQKKKKKLKTEQKEESLKVIGEIIQSDVELVLSRMLNIPLNHIVTEENNKLLSLEKSLKKNIIGQDHAVKSVSETIRRSKAGINDASRPIGSFIFLGPSGVGKTELAKILADQVFGGPTSLIRIDMSEFSESFNISKLIGSPAGYIGYKDPTKLTDMVRKRPYSVILFDEIEKAHPQIFNILLQILDDGHLTDATGKYINFKNTLIVMTSNIGSEEFNKLQAIGFADQSNKDSGRWNDAKHTILKKLGESFKNEFLNRIDKVIIFNPLQIESLKKIVKIQLKELEKRLLEKNVRLEYQPAVISFIAEKSRSAKEGARFVRKNISEHIENKVAELMISISEKDDYIIAVKHAKDSLFVEIKK